MTKQNASDSLKLNIFRTSSNRNWTYDDDVDEENSLQRHQQLKFIFPFLCSFRLYSLLLFLCVFVYFVCSLVLLLLLFRSSSSFSILRFIRLVRFRIFRLSSDLSEFVGAVVSRTYFPTDDFTLWHFVRLNTLKQRPHTNNNRNMLHACRTWR